MSFLDFFKSSPSTDEATPEAMARTSNSLYIYEVLIRGNASGIQGAHVIRAADSVDPFTGQANPTLGPAQPIPLADGQLLEILGEMTLTALAENALLRTEIESLRAKISD